MPAEAFAVLSAFCFGAAHVSSKRGLQDTSVIAGTVVVLGVSWVVISASMFVEFPSSTGAAAAIAILLVIGLLVPGVSRVAVLAGVDRLGPSISISIQHGLRPVLSVLGAVVLLGESVSVPQASGIVLIIAGGWRLSRRPREEAEGKVAERAGASRQPVTTGTASRRSPGRVLAVVRPGVIYPVIAALSFATWDLVVKRTLGSLSEPAFAAMLSTGMGLTAWVIAVATVPSLRARWRVGRGVRWLGLSGLLGGVAILGIFHALERGDVAVVAPITSTQPLAVLLLSLLFLRDLERISPTIVVAALAIVVGAILVSS